MSADLGCSLVFYWAAFQTLEKKIKNYTEKNSKKVVVNILDFVTILRQGGQLHQCH